MSRFWLLRGRQETSRSLSPSRGNGPASHLNRECLRLDPPWMLTDMPWTHPVSIPPDLALFPTPRFGEACRRSCGCPNQKHDLPPQQPSPHNPHQGWLQSNPLTSPRKQASPTPSSRDELARETARGLSEPASPGLGPAPLSPSQPSSVPSWLLKTVWRPVGPQSCLPLLSPST